MPELITSAPDYKARRRWDLSLHEYRQRHRSNLKRAIDVSVALMLICLSLPVFIIISFLVALDGGPVVFRQQRVGRKGIPFLCLKFRTMVPNAEQVLTELLATNVAAREEWERDFKLRKDPRITIIGRFLRKSSLDELPQLFNVVIGDMSLVGPRPIVSAEVVRYRDAIDHYYRCRPGITGLWQISGRNNVTYRRRIELDVKYASEPSIRHDFRILLKTAVVVLRGTGSS